MWNAIASLFDTSGFPARWNCGSWSDAQGYFHIFSDLGVWSAYVAIPCVLLYFVYRRKNLPFRYIFVLFGAFILFCGTTHLMEAIIFWWPAYRLAGLIKFATAVVSWATVVALIPIAPRVLSMKGPEELERVVRERTAELQREIAERAQTEEFLRQQRELFRVTLASIGDAVIATDGQGHVTFVNPVAESLTGWSHVDAIGAPLEQVFPIVNEQTRSRVENPCDKVLREGMVVGLANHTVLISRDGGETPIDDSAAPIKHPDGHTLGVVLVFRDATAQRLAVEAKERLAAIVENSHDAIIGADLQWTITSWNQGAESLFGYPAEEVIGRSLDVIVPPYRRQELVHAMEQLKRGEPVEHVDSIRLRKDGTPLEVSSHISPIKNAAGEVIGASKVSHEISERKRAERTLRFLSDASTTLSAVVDYDSTVQRVARIAVPFFADFCGLDMVNSSGQIERAAYAHTDPAKEPLLKELAERYPPDWNFPSFSAYVLRTGKPDMKSEIPEALLTSISQDPHHRELIRQLNPRSYISVPVVVRDKAVGALVFVVSGTRRGYTADDVELALELARRAATAIENAQLYRGLKDAERQKDNFLAMLAHELRNPLAAIQYANEILKLMQHDDKSLPEVIDRQVRILAHLVDDLLDVSRITRGKIQLKREVVDGALLLQRAVATSEPTIAARKHQLTVKIESEPLGLYADATRVEQILVNLLSNAAKYTPEEGQITVRCFAEDGQAVFQVRDTGIGIPREMLPKVFDLFTQADTSLDRSQGGLGIGLTVVRNLTEMHGGSVSVRSDGPGRGSEFNVRLPLSVAPAPIPSSTDPPTVPGARSLRVLVVDDNVDTANSLGRLLAMLGHETKTAHDGQTALDVARSFKPQVILLDLGLPGADGYQVANTLRQEPDFAKVRLIAVSGYGQPDDRRRSQTAGFDQHLVKPVGLDELSAILAELSLDA